MTTVEILSGGALTTVQDLGRPGLAALGIGRSGAADRGAAALANRLVGNSATSAVLETVLGGLCLRPDRPVVVAAAGTSAGLLVGGRHQPGHAPVRVPANQVIEIEAPQVGLRTYLAVAGGFIPPPVLGSRSCDTLAGIGPEPLQTGQVLTIGSATAPPGIAVIWAGLPTSPVTLDVSPGPRTDWFDITTLTVPSWQVAADLDRVGSRLTGGTVKRIVTADLPSEGVVRGAVQIPPDGRPVLFGADHPTTGGYPVIAVLTDRSADIAAQLKPGTTVRFRWNRRVR